MSLGDPYATTTELRERLDVTTETYDARLLEALNTASRGIDRICRRQFNLASSATARIYYPEHGCLVHVDDFYTTTGLIVATDTGDDGSYDTTWTASYYQLEPLNGVVEGEDGWPYSSIRAVSGLSFPDWSHRAPVQVTAKWGWTAVPAPVKEATLVVAEETFKLKDAPFGVAGFGDYGPVRVRQNPLAMSMIAPYRRNPILVG